MFHHPLTYQKISDVFHIITLIAIINLLCKILQIYYFPDVYALEMIIQNISNVCLVMTKIILAGLACKFFINHYKSFTKKHKIIAVSIIISMTMLISWIISMNKKIRLYLFIIKDMHGQNIGYFIFFVVCMLLIEIYYAYQNHTKINRISIVKTLYKDIKFILYKYFIIAISYLGLVQITEIHKFAIASITIIKSMTKEYIITLITMLIVVWISFFIYYLFNLFFHYENKK